MRQDPVRDEAERLVAAAVAAVSMAARAIPATGSRAVATGSEECCVCPVCRVIASMRDPSPEMTERLATGAGDLATAVTGVLRLLSRGGPAEPAAEEDPAGEGDEFWESLRRRAADAARTAARPGAAADDPWRQATTAPTTRPMAKKAVAKKTGAKPTAAEPVDEDSPAAPPPVVRRTVAKKAVAKKTAAPQPGASEPAAPPPPVKAVAKKAVAKKAVKKATPPGSGAGRS